jgi:pimeloyl-ACP methyl ester carboxylesterase
MRKWGQAPFKTVLLHGGPGAAGEMAPVARELSSSRYGVIEPFQSQATIQGQIDELKDVILKHAAAPVTLAGYSWGAFLAFMFAAQNPELADKVILISCGPFEDSYANRIMPTRRGRLTPEQRSELDHLFEKLRAEKGNRDSTLARLGSLIAQADAYDPIEHEENECEVRFDIHQSIWDEFTKIRSSGRLIDDAARITCPVVAIHGDYDPHPADGVRLPLTQVLMDFRFMLLEKCGHCPWYERHARTEFFKLMEAELPPAVNSQ